MKIAINPAVASRLEAQVGVTLSQAEKQAFDEEYSKLFGIYLKERDVAPIFAENIDYVYESLLEIRKALKNPTFQGMNAASGAMGWTLIRPEHVLAGTAVPSAGIQNIITWETTTTNATVNAATNGWVDWIGTSTTAKKVRKYAGIVVLALANHAISPKTMAVRFEVAGKKYNVLNIEEAVKIGNTKIFPLAKPFRVLPENDIYAQRKLLTSGMDELALLGVTFGTGVYLLETSPYVEA